MMNKQVKKRWIEALESGKYLQGQLALCKINASKHARYCCLGVLDKIENLGCIQLAKKGGDELLSSQALKKLGLKDEHQTRLANMNDGTGGFNHHSFKEIAKYIRENL